MNNSALISYKDPYHRLLRAAQIALMVGAFCGAVALLSIALPLFTFSWNIKLMATLATIASMFLAVLFLLITPCLKTHVGTDKDA